MLRRPTIMADIFKHFIPPFKKILATPLSGLKKLEILAREFSYALLRILVYACSTKKLGSFQTFFQKSYSKSSTLIDLSLFTKPVNSLPFMEILTNIIKNIYYKSSTRSFQSNQLLLNLQVLDRELYFQRYLNRMVATQIFSCTTFVALKRMFGTSLVHDTNIH